MAMFDFLTGAGAGGGTIPGGLGVSGPQSSALGHGVEQLFSDPNFLKALGGIGAGISTGQPVGQALGGAAQQMITNKALQEAAAKQTQREENMMQSVLRALGGGNLLSPTDRNDRFDNISITGDGDVSLKMKNTPQAPRFEGSQQALEGITRQKPPILNLPSSLSRGADLPDFF